VAIGDKFLSKSCAARCYEKVTATYPINYKF